MQSFCQVPNPRFLFRRFVLFPLRLSVSSLSVESIGMRWWLGGEGLQGEDKAIISANETALSQSTNVPASAAAPARVCWCVSACVRQCLRGNVRKVRQRSFSCKRMSPPPLPIPPTTPPPFVPSMAATASALSKDQSQLLVFKRRTSLSGWK